MTAGSLRLRLFMGAAIAISAALFLAGLALTALFEQEVRDRVMLELNNDLLQLAGALEITPAGEVKVGRTLADPRYEAPYSGKYWRIDRINTAAPDTSTEVLRSRSLWDTDPELAASDLRPESEQRVPAPRIVTI